MPRRIHKYEVNLLVNLPFCLQLNEPKFMHLGYQMHDYLRLFVWFEEEIVHERTEPKYYTFTVYRTGFNLPKDWPHLHLATVINPLNNMVWHLYGCEHELNNVRLDYD